MRIQTILNRVEKFKSFVSGEARLEERDGGPALMVQVLPRKNGKPSCSGCGRPGAADARQVGRVGQRRGTFPADQRPVTPRSRHRRSRHAARRSEGGACEPGRFPEELPSGSAPRPRGGIAAGARTRQGRTADDREGERRPFKPSVGRFPGSFDVVRAASPGLEPGQLRQPGIIGARGVSDTKSNGPDPPDSRIASRDTP